MKRNSRDIPNAMSKTLDCILVQFRENYKRFWDIWRNFNMDWQ